jgi:nucleoside-diphosphate-sugar epimerase
VKRRDFLRGAGATVAGGATAGALGRHDILAAETPAAALQPPRVLVTSADGELARTVAQGLTGKFRVALTASRDVTTDLPFTRSDLPHGAVTRALVRGLTAIVHVAETGTEADEPAAIESWPRATYNLLEAAVAEGVPRVVYLSTLRLMAGHDEQFQVDEDWQPWATPGAGCLAAHLGEFCCREFTRDGRLTVIVLRLGRLTAGTAAAGRGADVPLLDPADAVQAVALALQAPPIADGRGTANWAIFHVHSEAANTRFPRATAERLLGFRPKGVGSRFRPTMIHVASRIPENDSRPRHAEVTP